MTDQPDVTLSVELGDPDALAVTGLADPERYVIGQVARRAATRASVAAAYRLVLHSTDRGRVNWRAVNEAITARWSVSALEWIKREAWRQP